MPVPTGRARTKFWPHVWWAMKTGFKFSAGLSLVETVILVASLYAVDQPHFWTALFVGVRHVYPWVLGFIHLCNVIGNVWHTCPYEIVESITNPSREQAVAEAKSHAAAAHRAETC